MPNTTRRFKLEYTDSGGTVQTIAELGQNTGALAIDRFAHYRRLNDPDILKVWLEGKDFGNQIPARKSEFGTASNGTDEPEIRLKQYNPDTSSFDLVNRFFPKNKGTVNEDGELAWKLYSFFRFTGRQSVQTASPVGDVNSDGRTDYLDALLATLPSNGYAVDIPGDVTAPAVSNYSLDARRNKGYQELTRDINYGLTFTGNLDGSNNALVKYEPRGYGGTVDTLISNEQAGSYRIIDVDTTNDIFFVSGDRTDELVVNQSILVDGSTGNDGTYTISTLNYNSTTGETEITVSEDVTDSTADGIIIPGGQAIFKSWEKDKTDAIVNKVKVEGTNSSNQTVTATATNQTQIDNFGEKFKSYKIGYVENTTEAQNIAESYLVPGKDDSGNDIAKVPESGTLKTTVYTDNIVNDSVQVVDNKRNIDDTYTVVEQRNYWPEGASELELEFESENLEEAAREAENLRDERSRLYPSSTTDVGNQTLDTNNSNTTTSLTDLTVDDSGTNFDTSPPIASGQSTAEFIPLTSTSTSQTNFSLSDEGINSISDSLTYDGNLMFVDATIETQAGYGAEFIIELQVSDFPFWSFVTKTNNGGDIDVNVPLPGQQSGNTVEFLIVNKSGSSVTIDKQSLILNGENGHTHGSDTYESLDHNHAAGVDNDPGHGDTTDSSTHNLEGSTEGNVNVETASEDKTNRSG